MREDFIINIIILKFESNCFFLGDFHPVLDKHFPVFYFLCCDSHSWLLIGSKLKQFVVKWPDAFIWSFCDAVSYQNAV